MDANGYGSTNREDCKFVAGGIDWIDGEFSVVSSFAFRLAAAEVPGAARGFR